MSAARLSCVSLVLRLIAFDGGIGRSTDTDVSLSAGVGKLGGRCSSVGGVEEPVAVRSLLDSRSLRTFFANGRRVNSTVRSKSVVDLEKSDTSTSMRVLRGRSTRSLNATAHITFTLSPVVGASNQCDRPNGAWLRFVGSPRGFCNKSD